MKRDKSVPELVQKYRHRWPDLERDLLRKLMRIENPKLFLNNPSNLKKLDRHLKREFQKHPIQHLALSFEDEEALEAFYRDLRDHKIRIVKTEADVLITDRDHLKSDGGRYFEPEKGR